VSSGNADKYLTEKYEQGAELALITDFAMYGALAYN
jgi:hypothetical protein